MANKYDDADGVWRTIGGRRVFIRNGQSLSDAMKESGKFKSKKKGDNDKNLKQEEYIGDIPKSSYDIADEIEEKFGDKEVITRDEFEEFLTGKYDDEDADVRGILAQKGWETKFESDDEGDEGDLVRFGFDNEDDLSKVKRIQNELSKRDNLTPEEKAWQKQLADTQKRLENGKSREDIIKDLNKQAEEYAKTGLKDEESIKQSMQKVADVKNANKDGKYYKDRLLELDKADTPTGTYDIETGEIVDFKGKGYNVSFEQTGVQLSDEEYLAKINECRERCDGKVYFGKYGGTPEASFYTEDINEALKIMKENNQRSIYDVANDTEIFNDEYDASKNQIKDLSQTKSTNDNLDLTKENDRFLAKAQAYYDKENGKLSDEEYNKKLVDIDSNAGKTTNEANNVKVIGKYDFDGKKGEIQQYPNGKYYNHYGVSEKNKFGDEGVAGPFNSLEEAQEMMKKHRPNAVEEATKTTNDTMNEKIRAKASKKSTFKDDLPKHTEIKTQGTSNRKEVSENIQAHILDYYDSPQDFLDQMDAMDYLPTKWKQGEELAKGGSYLIYNDDMSNFLNELKINPKGKTFSEDKAFDMYTSLVGRESAKLYDRLMKNEFNKYKQSHPLTKMTLEEFIKSRKER